MPPADEARLLGGLIGLVWGLLAGSFLNVCILRWGEERSVLFDEPPRRRPAADAPEGTDPAPEPDAPWTEALPLWGPLRWAAGAFGELVGRLRAATPPRAARSACPGCGRAIGARDNIPVVSWLLLRGRCRGCGMRISPMYPLVELATGGAWALGFALEGVGLAGLHTALFLTLLIGIAVSDARTQWLPTPFTDGGVLLGLALSLLGAGPAPLDALLGATVMPTVMLAAGLVVSRLKGVQALGHGDPPVLSLVGAFGGLQAAVLTFGGGAALALVAAVPVVVGDLLRGRRDALPRDDETGEPRFAFAVYLAVAGAAAWLLRDLAAAWLFGMETP